jgi:hypothetical protein
MLLPPFWRKLVLTTHVATSVGFIGAVAAFLALAVAGLDGDAAVYPALPIMTWWVIVPLAVVSLLIGVVSSLGTPWGLLQHYWVATKLVLTILALGVLLLQTRTIDRLADVARAGGIGPASLEGQTAMVLHGGGGLGVLLLMIVLSVFKPRGITGLRL